MEALHEPEESHPARQLLLQLGILLFCGAVVQAAVPPPEKLLPEDTLAMLTAPDFSKIREISKASPQSRLWNDPAMRPFKEKFLTKWKDDLVKPLERELDIHFDDYMSLPQGQVTLAITSNSAEKEGMPGLLLLVDAGEKSPQLKTNLADVRKKWVAVGKTMKVEKIRNYEFSMLALSSNDVPKTLQKLLPQPSQDREATSEDEPKKPEKREEWIVGQAESLLIVCNSGKLVEKIVTHLAGGTLPSLSDVAAYDANHQGLLRGSPVYGWINTKAILDLLLKQAAEKKEDDASDPLGGIGPEKVLTASGLAGLKSLVFTFQSQAEGSTLQLFATVPEGSRQGLFKILASEPKDSNPPAFVPGDAVKFQRWRIDAQKAWATLEKMLSDISPQAVNQLNFLLDMANNAAKEKDPAFDVRKSFIGNLGDDLISYEKAPRSATLADLRSPPSIFFVGSPKPEQLAAALKSVLGFLNQQGAAPTEREFLGHKIFSLPLPQLPLPGAVPSKPGAPSKLHYAASGGYLALSTDPTLVEEYLRSAESQGKTLRQTSGLNEAAQKVTGPGTTLFGYVNQAETIRTVLELLKKDPASVTNGPMASIPGVPNPQVWFKDWFDFSLLPPYEKISKYFHFAVYGGGASSQGLSFKFFSPAPPQLKLVQNSGSGK